MSKCNQIIATIFTVAVLLSGTAASGVQAATIGFDSLSDGTTVGSNYSALGVTFIDAVVKTIGPVPGQSGANVIFHEDLGPRPTPSDPIQAIFTSAVSSVSIAGIDVGIDGMQLRAFDAVVGGSLLKEVQIIGTDAGIGDFYTLSVVASGIRRVEFSQVTRSNIDGAGFDNLTFGPSLTPIPGGLPLLLSALFSLGVMGWRRRKAA